MTDNERTTVQLMASVNTYLNLDSSTIASASLSLLGSHRGTVVELLNAAAFNAGYKDAIFSVIITFGRTPWLSIEPANTAAREFMRKYEELYLESELSHDL